MEKFSLPIKTKIAAWLMIIYGVIGFLSIGGAGSPVIIPPKFGEFGLIWASFVILFGGFLEIPSLSYLLILYFSVGAFLIIPIFLFKRRGWAWWINLINLALSLIFILSLSSKYWTKAVIYYFHPVFLLFLLLLDRKNFWKIAS